MHAFDRTLRQLADRLVPDPRRPTKAQLALRARIRAVGRTLLALYGLQALPSARLARALNLQPASFRRHVIDAEALTADLIAEELAYLAQCFAAVPPETPDRAARLRALWHAEPETSPHAEARRLILHELPHLPDDLRPPLARALDRLMTEMAGPLAAKYQELLASDAFTPADIETLLANIAVAHAAPGPDEAAAPRPEPVTAAQQAPDRADAPAVAPDRATAAAARAPDRATAAANATDHAAVPADAPDRPAAASAAPAIADPPPPPPPPAALYAAERVAAAIRALRANPPPRARCAPDGMPPPPRGAPPAPGPAPA